MRRFSVFVRRVVWARILLLRAQWAFRQGRDGAAETLARRVIALDPSSFRAHWLLAAVHGRRGDGASVLEALRVCFALDPVRLARTPIDSVWADATVPAPAAPDTAGSLRAPDVLRGPTTREVLEPRPVASTLRSPEEASRLAALPPITPTELAEVDFEVLIRRLQSGDVGANGPDVAGSY